MATNNQVLLGLFAAIYQRAPDKAGYEFWVNGFNAGTLTTKSAATAFSARPEWSQSYPSSLSTSQYVEKIYLNVLGIAGDANGRKFWASNIDSGSISRTDFVADFISATLDYNSTVDTVSTTAEKASALSAQTTIKSKVAFSEAWLATSNATDSAKTGVDANANYIPANDQSVALLAGVIDSATLTTQLSLIGNNTQPVVNNLIMGDATDNILKDTLGDNILNGGAGNDTAVFQGSSNDWAVLSKADKTLKLTATGEVNTLIDIEFIQFTGDKSPISTTDYFI